MSIKDNIKEELLKMVDNEIRYLNQREVLNSQLNLDNYDTLAERNFLVRLKQFAESI